MTDDNNNQISTSMLPEVRLASIRKSMVIDVIGLLGTVLLTYKGIFVAEVGAGIIVTILGLMRFKPVRDHGGPITAMLITTASLIAGKAKFF